MTEISDSISSSDDSFIISIQQIECNSHSEFTHKPHDFIQKNQSENLQIMQNNSDDKLISSLISDTKTKSAPHVLTSYCKSNKINFDKTESLKHNFKVTIDDSNEETLENSDCSSKVSCETCKLNLNANNKKVNLEILLDKLCNRKKDKEKCLRKETFKDSRPRFIDEAIKLLEDYKPLNQKQSYEVARSMQRKCFLDYNGFSLKESEVTRDQQETQKRLKFTSIPICKNKYGNIIANFIVPEE
jgi:hypothetical protein